MKGPACQRSTQSEGLVGKERSELEMSQAAYRVYNFGH